MLPMTPGNRARIALFRREIGAVVTAALVCCGLAACGAEGGDAGRDQPNVLPVGGSQGGAASVVGGQGGVAGAAGRAGSLRCRRAIRAAAVWRARPQAAARRERPEAVPAG